MKIGKFAARTFCLSLVELELSMRKRMSTLRFVDTGISFFTSMAGVDGSCEMSRVGQAARAKSAAPRATRNHLPHITHELKRNAGRREAFARWLDRIQRD